MYVLERIKHKKLMLLQSQAVGIGAKFRAALMRYSCAMSLYDDTLEQCCCPMPFCDVLVQCPYTVPLFAIPLYGAFVLVLCLCGALTQ